MIRPQSRRLAIPALLPMLLCACTAPVRDDAPPTEPAPASAPPAAATRDGAVTPGASTADAQDAGAGRHGDHDPRQRASVPMPRSPVVVPLDAATRAGLPRVAATGDLHGRRLRCEGVDLAALLRATGAMPAQPLRGADLGRYVQVDAGDGYRALFSLAELDPTLGDTRAVLADRCDGAPLAAGDGPLRLLVPAEARPARWVRAVTAVTVIVAP